GQKLTMQLFRFKSSLPGQIRLTNNQKSICVVGSWPEFGFRALACQCLRGRISVQNKLKLELQNRKGLPCKKWREVRLAGLAALLVFICLLFCMPTFAQDD